MTASAILFYIISALILTAGIAAVTTRKIFRSAIWLLFSLVGIAGLFFWMEMEFVAAVQVAVYVGGIVVLIIFSIFLTQQSGLEMPPPRTRQVVFAVVSAVCGFLLTYLVIDRHSFSQHRPKRTELGVSRIGMAMLDPGERGYLLPFEVVSLLLLAAMIGCIVIAMKPENKRV